MQHLGLERLAPTLEDLHFKDWWRRAYRQAGTEEREGVISMIQLVMWHMWKHMKTYVFDGEPPNIDRLL